MLRANSPTLSNNSPMRRKTSLPRSPTSPSILKRSQSPSKPNRSVRFDDSITNTQPTDDLTFHLKNFYQEIKSNNESRVNPFSVNRPGISTSNRSDKVISMIQNTKEKIMSRLNVATKPNPKPIPPTRKKVQVSVESLLSSVDNRKHILSKDRAEEYKVSFMQPKSHSRSRSEKSMNDVHETSVFEPKTLEISSRNRNFYKKLSKFYGKSDNSPISREASPGRKSSPEMT